jgi:membrane-bound serine protease (ClpP class)
MSVPNGPFHRARLALTIAALVLLGALPLLAQAPPPAKKEARPASGGNLQGGTRPKVFVAEVDAIIHPVSAEYMMATIDRADAEGAALVVFVLRTPGGLVDSTRSIVSKMIAAKTPVAVFVTPSGARAASAGFLITIAADIAAMSPGTSIGAAHPVSGDGTATDPTMAKKAASDVAAYARTIATKRGRNVKLSEQAVTESRAFTEQEARTAEPPLVDVIAADVDDLLKQLDGRTVTRFDGRTATLRTAPAERVEVAMTWRQRILSAVAHPQVAYLLFSLGTLGLTIELWNPGAILPGVVGGLCLLLAFFAFSILPINYAGLLLILFGLVLLILEVKIASFGLLAIGGFVSLVLGSMMLIDSPLPELQIGLRFIMPLMLAFGGIILFLVRLSVNAQRQLATTGVQGMVGEPGRVIAAIAPGAEGSVSTRGEIWRALSDEPLAEGDAIRVVSVEGLTLRVRRAGRPLGGA